MSSKVLDIEKVHDGKFLHFYNFNLDDGRSYEVISRRDNVGLDTLNRFEADAVDIIAFTPDHSKILVIKEWRVPANGYIYSFPAGLREDNEGLLDTARRELKEETGLEITKLYDILPPAYQSAGMTNEVVASVVCEADGDFDEQKLETTEDIHPVWIDREDAMNLFYTHKLSARCQMVLWFCLFGEKYQLGYTE